MRFFGITFFFVLLFSTDVIAQLLPSFNYSDGNNICGQSTLNVEIKNTSSSDIGPVISEYDLNAYMHIDSVWTNVESHFLNITGNKIRFVFDTLLGGQGSIFFHIKMSTGGACNLVSCSNAFLSIDKLQLRYNSKTETHENKQSLKSACLTYDENLFDKRIYSAFIGDTIIRKIVLLNTGAGKFDGYIQVKDIFGSYVEVDSIYSDSPGYSISNSQQINDSTRIFLAHFSNIEKGDSIFLFEKVIVKKCIEEDFGKSSIYINWSCDNSLCKEATPYPIIAQILKNNKKPELIIRKVVTPESNCLNTGSKNTYIVKNRGLRPAIDLKFELTAENPDTYTYIDKTSLTLKDTTGLILTQSSVSDLVPAIPDPFSFEHSCIISDPLKKWNFVIKTLVPNDSFIVEYETFHCCPADDTTNTELFFETWYLKVDYTDQCEDEDFSAASYVEESNSIFLSQFYEPIVTDMDGFAQDTFNFEIFNTDFSSNFYRINSDSAAFKIILKVDTGLVFLPNSLRITSIFGKTLLADKVELVAGGLAEGYKDNMLVATFILPDTFRINPIYFGRFMRNSSVSFDLHPECPAKVPSSRFTQEVYFIPDLNCPGACEILLSTHTSEIFVHCPGCILPGWIVNYYKATRLTLGEQDNNNDRLPDNLSYTSPDKNLIKINRYMPGDTLETEMRAVLQDGDPFLGKTMHQLENNGINSINFKYSYLSTDFSFGKLYKLNFVKVIILDSDQSELLLGSDTLFLPASTVQKIDHPVDSTSSAQFFYDMSLDTLQKYGLSPSYKYEPWDQVKVISNFTIQEFSDHYLINPPSETDPWLEFEESALHITYYRNLFYMTGVKDSPSDADVDAYNAFQQDPNSLDSTMIYWCEGFGGASTLVGRGKNVFMNIPEIVQCSSRATVTFTMTPSLGIFKNPFPYEYRNFVTLDSLVLDVPSGYHFKKWTITNSIDRPDGSLEFEPCAVEDSLAGIDEDGPAITIPINDLFSKFTQYNSSPCLDGLMYGDENISTTLGFSIVPDCDLPETPLFFASPRLYYQILPQKIRQEFVLTKSPSVKKTNAKLRLSPATNESYVSKKSFCYPINLEETKGGIAGFSFIKINSYNNKIIAESLEDLETQEIFFPDSTGLFRLDSTQARSIRQFNLCLSNLCGKVISKDSLLIVYGHDCNEYPNSTFTNICKFDSIIHYAVPANLGVQSFLDAPASIKMCQPFTIRYDYQFTGLGSLENLLLKVHNQVTEGVEVISGSLEINGTSASISSTYDELNTQFNLKTVLNSIYPQGLKSGDNLTLSLTLNTDCLYSGLDISTQLVLITSSCDTLYDDSLKYSPATLTGYPVADNKSITASFTEFKNTGGVSDVAIQVHNHSAAPTINKTKIIYFLPAGFSFQGMISSSAPSSVTDSTVVWILNPGIATGHQELIFKVIHEPLVCDSIEFKILLGDISESCAGAPCIQRDSNFYFKQPVKCYPCPPVLYKEDRCKGLPIFNTIYWEYQKHFYCPEEYNYIYSVYYSPEIDGTYQLIYQTQDTSFLHEGIPSYDGCYYVIIEDTAGVVSEQSNIICNTTCNEQFKCQDLFIPNLISPNGDNLNDTFTVTGAYLELKVEVYNRWGKLAYKSDNYKNDWQGEGLTEGIYFWYLYVDNSEEACLGWIQIIK